VPDGSDAPGADRTSDLTGALGAPQQGVIEDARRRQRSRRRRLAVVLIAVFAAGATVAGVLEGGGSGGSSARARSPARVAAIRELLETSGNVKLSPALEGGAYGWCVHLGNGASCATLPTTDTPLQGSVAFSVGNAHRESFITLLAPQVAGVLLDGQRLQMVVERSYPAMHLRVAKVTLPLPSKVPGGGEEREQALTAIDARGRVIHRGGAGKSEPQSKRAIWWQRPHRMPGGPCQIEAEGMPDLLPQWGFVARAIRPYPGTIVGRAFYSCISVEYYLHAWPLIAAVLLDAQHPGRTPGAIPEMKPLPGSPGLFTVPGDGGFHGEETAERSGDRWLVVAGGSGLTQRLQVLEHLRASVRLPARRV
jgi:hypothetical protein